MNLNNMNFTHSTEFWNKTLKNKNYLNINDKFYYLINKEAITHEADGDCGNCEYSTRHGCNADYKNLYINGIKYENKPAWKTMCLIYSTLKGEEIKDKRELLIAKLEDSIKFEIKEAGE